MHLWKERDIKLHIKLKVVEEKKIFPKISLKTRMLKKRSYVLTRRGGKVTISQRKDG